MRWVISILFIIAFQWYAFQGIKTITNERSVIAAYWFIVIGILGNILWHTLFFDRSGGFTHSLSYYIGPTLDYIPYRRLRDQLGIYQCNMDWRFRKILPQYQRCMLGLCY